MAQPQSDEFKVAAKRSKDMESLPEDHELLSLYALYKQGIQDPPIEKAAEPGFGFSYDKMRAKAKKRAWQKVVDEGVTPEEAQKRYVELVDQLLNTYGDKNANKSSAKE